MLQSINEGWRREWMEYVNLFTATTLLTFFAFPVLWQGVSVAKEGGGLFGGPAVFVGMVVVPFAFVIGAALFFLTLPVFASFLPGIVAYVVCCAAAAFFGASVPLAVLVDSSFAAAVGGTAAAISCVVSLFIFLKGRRS